MNSRQNNQYPVAAHDPPPAMNGAPPIHYPPQPSHPSHAIPHAPHTSHTPHDAAQVRSYQGTRNSRTYKLRVEQQPVRARMCGFGDKDRRPITPPPCIRLVVCDVSTGLEIDASDVDSTFFVLTVDLWDADGTREVNLVRHSSGAPTVSISSSTTTSYPPPPERLYTPTVMPTYDAYGRVIPQNPYGPPSYYSGAPQPYAYGTPHPYAPPPPMPMPLGIPAQHTSTGGMFTRNLIGSLTVNAFKLTDTEGKVGFWFVLQDLSVRTEGSFRLKMNFVDVGSGQSNNQLNTGRAPVLANTFSEPFQVYSAKKFPGVIESTPLSKAFASQGIKIPIRKDGPKQSNNLAEYDNDD